MYKDYLDFLVNVNEDRDIKILQLTDFQPIDPSQQRFFDRLHGVPSQPFSQIEKNNRLYRYIDEHIKDSQPDLILITGDIIYGEFDDNGSNLLEIIEFMDKYQIPWAPIFGNHDRESKKGVRWQCQQFENSKFCLFKHGNVTGNCNYTIGVLRENKLVNVIFMVDSNGTGHGHRYTYLTDYPLYNLDENVIEEPAIFKDQIDWIDNISTKIESEYPDVKEMLCTHIVPEFISKQCEKNHYQADSEYMNSETYTLGIDRVALNGDSGTKGERYCSCQTFNLLDVLKKHNFTHMFVGHDHVNDISVLCDTVRVTFGMKTGTFDYYKNIGYTLIKIDKNNEVSFKHELAKEIYKR